MIGDVINLDERQYKIAEKIFSHYSDLFINRKKIVISVCGESGCGKSSTAIALKTILERNNFLCYIAHQDNYYILPPYSNDKKRREDIRWIGPNEVNIKLVNFHIKNFLENEDIIEVPIVDYHNDSISYQNEKIKNCNIFLVEGTYCALASNIDINIFIDRDWKITKMDRQKRARAEHELDEFTEKVLQIEHNLISAHKLDADVIILDDFSVQFQE